jgi:RHS repeat-associated protein
LKRNEVVLSVRTVLGSLIRPGPLRSSELAHLFPAGTNDGKISTQTDNLSGETVTYQYDSLNRLLSASSTQSWSETYGFDGFGNLLTKTPTGGAPTLSQSVNPVNNQIVGQTYDSNGNQLSSPLGTLAYDAENRIASMAAGGVQYADDSRNKRIWRSILSNGNLAQQVFFYGVDGQKLGTYTFTLAMIGNAAEMTNSTVLLATFFGSKRVGTYDRLGSAKYNQQNNQAQSFYPYGEDRGTVQPNDELKFATYTRDSATGLDYADQRYYANNFGRFMTADRFKASGRAKDPGSWNRYAYTRGDPANRLDPSGRFDCNPDDDACQEEPTSGPCAGGSGTGFIGDDPDPAGPTPCNDTQEFVDTAPPPCWQDIGKVFQTLEDIGQNIVEILQQQDPGISNSKIVGLDAIIETDVNLEIATTFASGLAGPPPAGPDYVGGHFNLYLSTSSLQTTLGSDFTNFQSIFGGSIDGTRQPAVFGNPAQSNYTLHSKEIGNNSTFQFHFDKYNPFSFGTFGLVKHFFAEVLGGHIGTPCLDPAWSAARQ